VTSVPSGERIFYFLNKFQKKGLKICCFRELPMKDKKISSFIAVFALSRGLSMKDKKIFFQNPSFFTSPVAYR